MFACAARELIFGAFVSRAGSMSFRIFSVLTRYLALPHLCYPFLRSARLMFFPDFASRAFFMFLFPLCVVSQGGSFFSSMSLGVSACYSFCGYFSVWMLFCCFFFGFVCFSFFLVAFFVITCGCCCVHFCLNFSSLSLIFLRLFVLLSVALRVFCACLIFQFCVFLVCGCGCWLLFRVVLSFGLMFWVRRFRLALVFSLGCWPFVVVCVLVGSMVLVFVFLLSCILVGRGFVVRLYVVGILDVAVLAGCAWLRLSILAPFFIGYAVSFML